MSKEFRTSVGGQALMEGIMMRGPEKICCAVRKPDGTIDLSYDTVTTHWYNRIPLVRGACYEAGLPLTVENSRKQSRFHPRCGTSFMILVIIISIFLYAVLPWTSTALRVVYKLCMFPILVGISYEILKWAGRSHSTLAKLVSQPGLWMQRLTTFEPDDSMIEVAIAAVTPVLPENQEDARW